jgi:hypothetical protein
VLSDEVLLVTMAGRGSVEVDNHVMAQIDSMLQVSHRIRLYCDMRGFTRMAPGTKETSVAWGKKTNGRVQTHILVNSRIVEMALSVLSMLSGNPIKMFSNEMQFSMCLHGEGFGIVPLPYLAPPLKRHAG